MSIFFKRLVHQKGLKFLHYATIALFIVIAYYPSLDVPFMFDDYPNIIANPAVHPETLSDLIDVFDSPVSSDRPLALLSFALNYWLHGLDEFGYHLVNILIHLLNAFLLYTIFVKFPLPYNDADQDRNKQDNYYRYNLAFYAAALWAVNPVHTQAVTYIVQRMTSMASLFYLAAVYLFLEWHHGRLTHIAASLLIAACFVLGMACKPIVITLLPALILLDFICFTKKGRRLPRTIISLLLLTAGLVSAAFLGTSFPDWFTTYPNRNFSPWERVMTEWRVVWHYLSLYFVPLSERLHLVYGIDISRGFLQPWTTLVGLLAMAAVWIAAWFARNKYKTTVFCIYFFFLALVVESTFLNLEPAFIHRLYLPSAFLWFGLLAFIPPAVFKKGNVVLLLVLLMLAYNTVIRNVEWQHAKAFWSMDLDRGSTPARAMNNRAASLIESSRLDEAVPLLQQALSMADRDRDRKRILYNLGTVYFYQNKYDQALAAFKKLAEKYEGGYRETYLFIGQIFIKQGHIKRAQKIAEILTANKTSRYQGKILEAYILNNKGEHDKAVRLLIKTIEKEPAGIIESQVRLRFALAKIFLEQEKLREAYETYMEITEIFPQNYSAWKMIYRMLVAGNDQEKAEKVKNFLEGEGVKIE